MAREANDPVNLYEQARQEFPDDKGARGKRYLELLREAGHVIERKPDDKSKLFECGFDPRKASHA
jgi:hypothetical protein